MGRRGIIGAVAALLLLAGCNAPTHQYIASKSYGMYFALPKSWNRIPDVQLTTAERGWSDDAGSVFHQTVLWQGAWAESTRNANDVLAATPPTVPIVFSFVRDLIPVEAQSIGPDAASALRDLVIPASDLPVGAVTTKTLRDAGFVGIEQRAHYAVHGTQQTVVVVSMLAPGKNRVYVLSVRCTTTCFAAQRSAIDAIIASLTFKEPRA